MKNAPFARELLNSLTAHIAVMDGDGLIVAVNDAWRNFARDNGGGEGACDVGADYLRACREAGRQGDEPSARAAEAGLEQIRRGERAEFSVEYPCHSPSVRRWFIARFTRFTHEGAPYLVAVHEEITARREAEESLRRAKADLDAMNTALQQALARERHKARTDELTGVCNRRQFFELSRQLFAVAQRYRSPLSVCLFDIDYFKRINDRFGHLVGDAILQRVARIAREYVRESDVLARYGGEEFIVTFPNTGARDALAPVENIRRQIAGCRELPAVGEDLRVTISAGIAQIRHAEDTLDALVSRADRSLYAAKDAGRNCTRMDASVPPPG